MGTGVLARLADLDSQVAEIMEAARSNIFFRQCHEIAIQRGNATGRPQLQSHPVPRLSSGPAFMSNIVCLYLCGFMFCFILIA